MDDSPSPVLRVIHDLSEVSAQTWDAVANPAGDIANPFVTHAFLQSLEESGSATRKTGWMPYHLLLEEYASGPLIGAVPMYLKSHSRGEYVFDSGWADALERAGGSYYPKLQVSVPFTPATGPRLLTRPGPHRLDDQATLATAAVEVAKQLGVSSLHMTFLPVAQSALLTELGLLQRTDQQFHWHNQSYRHFDDFLESLSSRKRKMIRKERERAVENGVTIERLSGSDITEAHWDAFFAFYMDTGNRKWGSPYLTRSFFSLIGERMAKDVLLVMARRDDHYIAGAINFIGGDALYGRNWGAIEHHPFLHFECCYYQAIEFAIERALARVEAGAQGEHKLARGYLPAKTYSAHWIANESFHDAVAHYLERERQHVDHDIALLSEYSPFKHMNDTAHQEEEF